MYIRNVRGLRRLDNPGAGIQDVHTCRKIWRCIGPAGQRDPTSNIVWPPVESWNPVSSLEQIAVAEHLSRSAPPRCGTGNWSPPFVAYWPCPCAVHGTWVSLGWMLKDPSHSTYRKAVHVVRGGIISSFDHRKRASSVPPFTTVMWLACLACTSILR